MLSRNFLIELDPRTFDILRRCPKKDAAQLSGILCIEGLINILLELFVQRVLDLTPCCRFRHLLNDGIRIFRNALFNIFQTDKYIYKGLFDPTLRGA